MFYNIGYEDVEGEMNSSYLIHIFKRKQRKVELTYSLFIFDYVYVHSLLRLKF
jgi:hypothetical protein